MAAQQAPTGGLTREGVQQVYGITKRAHDSAYAGMKMETRKLAEPSRTSDTYRSSKRKKHRRRHEGRTHPSKGCICAISNDCPNKAEGQHDCRNLAPMPKAAHDRGWHDHLPGRQVDTHISKHLAELIRAVTYLAVLIQDLKSVNANFPQIHLYIRKWLSDMRCFDMTGDIFIASKIKNVISDFFDWIRDDLIPFSQVPEDIRGDLTWLKWRWQKGDWNLSDPLRGMKVAYTGGRLGRSLDKDWKFYKPKWNRFGHNGLMSGEAWPYQIVMMRDGAHGSPEAGISGVDGKGATSIVLSNPENRDEYADWDMGHRIGYVSTASPTGSPTRCTQYLLDSYAWSLSSRAQTEANPSSRDNEEQRPTPKDDRPVRVFRSWKLPPQNAWRPENGFRYDGLYDVVGKELIDPDRSLYRFTMERRPNQGQIRIDQPDNQTLLLWYQCAAVQKTAS